MSERPPTPGDPVLVATSDQRFISCWVEDFVENSGEPLTGSRWILLGPGGSRVSGPVYRGEKSVDAVRTVVNAWLDRERSLDISNERD